MLLVPRRNHSVSLFDEMFNDPFFRDPFFTTSLRSFGGNSLMKTDISEKNGEYHIVDIVIENVSLAITACNEYNAFIKNNPGALIDPGTL